MRAELCLLVLLGGCASVDAARRPEAALPDSFGAAGAPDGGASVAEMNWRTYFQDERLVAAIGEALEGNLDRAIALQRVEASRAHVTRSTGALFPRLDATLGAGVRKYGLYTMDGAGNATTDITPGQLVPVHLGDFALGLQASWEVDLWGKLRSERKAAASRVLASEEGAHLVTTALVADVATAWFDLQALDRVFEVLQQALSRQEEALHVVRLQKAAGRTSELAVQQFEAQLAELRAIEAEMTQQRVEAQNQLNLLLGRYPREVERKAELSFAPLPGVSTGLPSELLVNRPDVRAAELQLRAAEFDVQAARAAFFPNINLSAGVALQAFNPAFLVRLPESLAYSVLGGLVAPLINRAGIEAEFQGAQAAQLEALYQYQKVVLAAYIEVCSGLANLENVERLVSSRRQQREAVQRSVETADLLFRAGKASWLEVLTAQQGALKADLELVEAWRRQRLASVSIYRALGGGWRE